MTLGGDSISPPYGYEDRDTACRDAAEAAERLKEGTVVDWQPGDGTRYECALFIDAARSRQFLLLLNFGYMLAKDNNGPHSHLGMWAHKIPWGFWAGMRPLLAALGWAAGEPVYDHRDALKEGDERKNSHKRGPDPFRSEQRRDAELGQFVRGQLEAAGYIVKADSGG